MAARILLEDEEKIVIEVTISKNSNFLEFEERLQGVLSEAGRQVTERALADFDADGSALLVGGTKFTITPIKGRTLRYQLGDGLLDSLRC